MIAVSSNRSCSILLNSGYFKEAFRYTHGWFLVLRDKDDSRSVNELIEHHNLPDVSLVDGTVQFGY